MYQSHTPGLPESEEYPTVRNGTLPNDAKLQVLGGGKALAAYRKQHLPRNM